MRALRALLPLGAALLLAACGGSEEADPDLVVVSTRDGDYALFTVSTSGGDEQRLTDADVDPSTPEGLFFQTEPAWSPDGGTIAFASARAGTFDLYTMDADGSGTQPLTATSENDRQPTWSPDGARIAFARGATAHLFVVDVDGSGARRVTNDGGVAEGPSWSPDGRRLAFTAIVGERLAIYTIRADGKNARPVATGAFEPAWSPDGKTIAFSKDGAIFALEIATGEERRLTDAENNDSNPTWRPGSGAESD